MLRVRFYIEHKTSKIQNTKIGTLLTLLFINCYASCNILDPTKSLAYDISTPKVYQTKRPEQVYTNQLGVIIINIFIRDYFKYKSISTSNVPVDVLILLIQLDTGPYEKTEEDNMPYANILVVNVEES